VLSQGQHDGLWQAVALAKGAGDVDWIISQAKLDAPRPPLANIHCRNEQGGPRVVLLLLLLVVVIVLLLVLLGSRLQRAIGGHGWGWLVGRAWAQNRGAHRCAGAVAA
jgi:hypothetical protein